MIASFSLVINAMNSILNAPQLARLRMDINSLVNAVPKVLMMALTPVVLYLGGGLLAAVLVGFVGGLIILCGHIFFSRRLLPQFFGLSINRSLFGPLFRFGSGWLVASAAIMLLGNMEKFFLTKLTSPQTLAHYSIAATLAMMTTMLPLAMTQSLVPAFAQLSSAEKREELQALFSRAVRLNALWLFPAMMIGIVFAKPFLARWVGDEFANASAVPFYILLLGVFVNVVAYIPWAMLISSGKTRLLGRIYFMELFLYAAVAYFLISRFGIIGAAVAWSLRVALDGTLLFLMSRHFFGTRIGLIERLGGLILSAAVLAIPLIFRFFFYGFSAIVVASAIIACGVYAFIGWKMLIGSEERNWLSRRFHNYLGSATSI